MIVNPFPIILGLGVDLLGLLYSSHVVILIVIDVGSKIPPKCAESGNEWPLPQQHTLLLGGEISR